MKYGTIHTDAAARRCIAKTPQEQLEECRAQMRAMRELEKKPSDDEHYDDLIKGVECCDEE